MGSGDVGARSDVPTDDTSKLHRSVRFEVGPRLLKPILAEVTEGDGLGPVMAAFTNLNQQASHRFVCLALRPGNSSGQLPTPAGDGIASSVDPQAPRLSPALDGPLHRPKLPQVGDNCDHR